MKLKEIAIDGLKWTTTDNHLQLSDGLNLLWVDLPDSALRLRQGLRHVMFGTDPSLWSAQWLNLQRLSTSVVELERVGRRYRLARDLQLTAPIRVHSNGIELMPESHETQWLQHLELSVFATFFDLDTDRVDWQIMEMIRQLPSRWNVPIGERYWKSESDYQNWRREAEFRRQRWSQLLTELEELENEQHRLLSERDSFETQQRQRRLQLERELADLETRLQQIQNRLSAIDPELVQIDRELEHLRYELSHSTQEVRYVPVQAPHSERLQILYAWLDGLDLDLARWQALQRQIQARRLHLRDEMTLWNERSLSDEQHPYRQAHALLEQSLGAIESLEQLHHHWPTVISGTTPIGESALAANQDFPKRAVGITDKLRRAQEGLIQELGQQFTQLRHRAAAAEMKELREYFNRAQSAIDSLLESRRQAILSIREIDAVGAQAIESAETRFMDWANREGYLSARRQFFGAEPAPTELFEYQIYQPDLTIPRQRLSTLEARRTAILAERNSLQSEYNHLAARRETLIRERDQWHLSNAQRWALRLPEIERRIIELRTERDQLGPRITEDERQPAFSASPFTARIAYWLNRLSGSDDYLDLSLPGDARVLLWHTRSGNLAPWPQATSRLKEHTILSIAFAASESLRQQHVDFPIWLTHVSKSWELESVMRLALCLRELASQGEQVVWVMDQQERVEPRWLEAIADFRQFSIRSSQAVAAIPTPPATWKPVPPISTQVVESPTFVPLAKTTRTVWQPVQPTSAPLSSEVAKVPVVYTDRIDYRLYPTSRVSTNSEWPEAVSPLGVGSFTLDTNGSHLSPSVADSQMQLPTPFANIQTHTSLKQIDLIDPLQLRSLQQIDVHTIADLLELDPGRMPQALESAGITPSQLDRWQAQAWLLVCAPGLSPTDSRILVACGISEPEHLENTSGNQLLARIHRFLQSPDGRRVSVRGDQYDLSRVNQWQQSLRNTRSRWRRDSGYSRRHRLAANHSESRPPVESDNSPGSHFSQSRSRELRPGVPYFSRSAKANPMPRPVVDRPTLHRGEFGPQVVAASEFDNPLVRTASLAPTERTTRSEPMLRSVSNIDNGPAPGTSAPPVENTNDRFYLNLQDPVEAAPSIGPKTAERFLNIGVNSIGDFLRTTAESMSEKIDYKRITADVIRQWQQQARLVCRVPNLRGHDAQLLVACGITEPEDLAGFTPKSLLDRVGPFADTKEGLKIVRAGKKPDLQEVTDWIQWAKNTRSIQAA